MSFDSNARPAPPKVDRYSDEQVLAEAGAELDQVEAALARLEDGTLGRCGVCDRPVDRDQLLNHPLRVRCPQHV